MASKEDLELTLAEAEQQLRRLENQKTNQRGIDIAAQKVIDLREELKNAG